MNWEAMGAIGEISGAIAVFATLVYLSIQIKQSSNWQAIRKTIQSNGSFANSGSNAISPWMRTEWEAIRSEFPEDFQNFIEALQK